MGLSTAILIGAAMISGAILVARFGARVRDPVSPWLRSWWWRQGEVARDTMARLGGMAAIVLAIVVAMVAIGWISARLGRGY
jgi:hypothetical protein